MRCVFSNPSVASLIVNYLLYYQNKFNSNFEFKSRCFKSATFFHHSRTLKIWKLLWKYHRWQENYNSNNKKKPQGMKLTKGANQLWRPQMIQQEAEKSMIRKFLVSMSQKNQTGLQTCDSNSWRIVIIRKKLLDKATIVLNQMKALLKASKSNWNKSIEVLALSTELLQCGLKC